MLENQTHSPVTHWIDQLKAGESVAAVPIWERYFVRLVTLARQRLRGVRPASADEEDVALSAFDSFCRGAEQGRFPRLDDRNDLWQVLIMITARKAVNLLRHEGRDRRGGGKVIAVSVVADRAGEDGDLLAQVAGREPTPEFAAQVTDECRCLLALLPDDAIRQIALWKMEGYSNREIATKIGRSEGAVERKLKLIRKAWEGKARH